MIHVKRSQIQPIGVDFGFDSIKLLQLEVVDGQLAVVGAARHPLPDEARREPSLRLPVAMDILRRLLRSGQFSGRRIVTAMPREFVHVKNLRLPHMPPADLASAVEFEARNIFPFDTEQALVRFLYAGEVRQGNDSRDEAIVLAAKRVEVDDFLEQLHRCGVVVESLDFEPAAIYRTVERFIRRREDEHEVHVLVDIGARRSQVVIGRGRDISFFKPIDIGGQHLHEAVARKLGVTVEEARSLRCRLIDAVANASDTNAAKPDPVRQAVFDATRSVVEDLAREISLCLRYYSVTFRGQRPARLRLTGGEACDTQLQSILGANLAVPVEAARPLHSVDTARMKPSDQRGLMCEWTVACGLGLKLVKEHFGARDGRKRDITAPRNIDSSSAFVPSIATDASGIVGGVQTSAPEASGNSTEVAAQPGEVVRG